MIGRMLAGAAAISCLDNKVHAANANLAGIDPKDRIKITKLETFPISRTKECKDIGATSSSTGITGAMRNLGII